MHFRIIYRVVIAVFWTAIQAGADGKINTLSLVEDPAISTTSTSQGKGKGSRKKQKTALSVVLMVDTLPDNEYRIQATDSLVSGIWEDIGALFTATQSVTTVSFPESDAYRYFRVIVVSQKFEPPSPPPPGSPPPPPA